MLLDLQHFVSINAILTQILFWSAGLLLLSGYYRRKWTMLSCAMAYPVGAVIAGTIQWSAFIIGKAEWAPVVYIVFVLFVILWWWWRGKGEEGEADSKEQIVKSEGRSWSSVSSLCGMKQLSVVIICIMALIGYFVMQSSDVSESDPRWQWAYRAKIMASFSGYELPQFKDPEVHNINRKYPLMYCGIGALSMRFLGTPKSPTVFRAINYFFFLSYLLLLYAYACPRRSWWGLIFVLCALATTPHFWAMSVDENYVDFPLGVMVAMWIVGVGRGKWEEQRATKEELRADRRVRGVQSTEGGQIKDYFLPSIVQALQASAYRIDWLPGIILGIGIIGFKAEGVLLFTAATSGLVAMWLYSEEWVMGGMTVAISCVAFFLVMILIYAGQIQIAPDVSMENVTFSDLSLRRFMENLERLPVILNAFLIKYPLDFRRLGLLVPFLVLGMFWSRVRMIVPILVATTVYLILMTIPFIVTPWDDVAFHLQTVTSRMWWHIIPLLCLGLSGACLNKSIKIN